MDLVGKDEAVEAIAHAVEDDEHLEHVDLMAIGELQEREIAQAGGSLGIQVDGAGSGEHKGGEHSSARWVSMHDVNVRAELRRRLGDDEPERDRRRRRQQLEDVDECVMDGLRLRGESLLVA